MTETPAAREAVAKMLVKALGEHHFDSSDEQRVNGKWTWGLNCDCGEFVPDAEVYNHVAQALLPFLAEREAAARSEALREAADAITSGDADHEELRLAGVDDIAKLGWSERSVAIAYDSGDVWASWLRNRAAITTGAPDA